MHNNSAPDFGELSPGKKVAFFTMMLLIPVVLVAVAYTAYAVYQSKEVYLKAKNNKRGWNGNVHRADPTLGFVPIPGASGAEVFPIGPEKPATLPPAIADISSISSSAKKAFETSFFLSIR